MSNTVKRGDTHAITLTVKDSAGLPVDLTGATVRLLASITNSPDPAEVLPATITDAVNGVVTHTLTGALLAGTYQIEVEATIGGVITTAPTDGYATLIVKADLG